MLVIKIKPCIIEGLILTILLIINFVYSTIVLYSIFFVIDWLICAWFD